MIFFMSFQNS